MKKKLVLIIIIFPLFFQAKANILSFVETNFYIPYLITAQVYYDQGKYDSSLLYYSIPYGISTGNWLRDDDSLGLNVKKLYINRSLWALTNLRLGQIYYYLGLVVLSQEQLTISKTTLESYNNQGIQLAKCYYFLGLACSSQYMYTESLSYYYKSLRIYESLGLMNSNEVGYIYLNSGTVFAYQGEYNQAIEYFNKSLDILQNQSNIKDDKVSIIINNLGSIYFAKGNLESAKENYLAAVEIASRNTVRPTSDLAMYYNNLAGIYSIEEKYDSAELFYKKSLCIRNQIFSKNHISQSQSFYHLGIVSYYKNDFAMALTRVNESIKRNSYLYDISNKTHNTRFSNVINYNLMASSLCLKADIYQGLYFQSNDSDYYNLTLVAFDSLLSFTSNYIKYNLNDDNYYSYVDILENGINSALTFYSQTQFRSEEVKFKFFQFVEHGKSIKLRKTLIESNAKKFSKIPDSLVKIEYDIKNKIIENRITLIKATIGNSESIVTNKYLEIIDKRNKLKCELDSLIHLFEISYDDYYNLKYNHSQFKIDSLQNSLQDSSAIVEYYIGDSAIFIIYISKHEFEIYQTAIDSLDFTIKRHLHNILFSSIVSLNKSGSRLFKYLISPIAKRLNNSKKIIIIPDEYLYHIPFETIVIPQCNSVYINYLINHFEISYQFSSSIWMMSQNNLLKNNFDNYCFLGFAPFSKSKSEKTSSSGYLLPFSKNEIFTIGSLFERAGYNSLLLYGDDASKNNFCEKSQYYSHIHLATHSYFDEKNPDLSSILFDSTNKLFIGESYNLILNAELVVLSSCKSGMGELIKREGIMSLARGFFYSGARRVLYSLWNVHDKATYILFKNFYRYISEGISPSKALQKSKVLLLSNPKTSLPIFWGGFLLLGS